MAEHPCDDHRHAIEIRLAGLREVLGAHLEHEETVVLPLVQRVMTEDEFAAGECATERRYRLHDAPAGRRSNGPLRGRRMPDWHWCTTEPAEDSAQPGPSDPASAGGRVSPSWATSRVGLAPLRLWKSRTRCIWS